jgi:hypothetical protein
MRLDSCRRALAQLLSGLVLVLPLTASAADPVFWRLAQALERDMRFEDCALVCQQHVDRQIAQCAGLKEVLNPADNSAPPPKCRQTAGAEYEGCMSACAAPRYSQGG